MALMAGILDTDTSKIQDVKVNSSGAMLVTNGADTDNIVSLKGNDGSATEYEAKVNSNGYLKVIQEGSNEGVLSETTVTFSESAAIATQATAKSIAITNPDPLQKDALYYVEVRNPSTVSDMQIECYNVSPFTVDTATVNEDVFLTSYTVPKTALTTNVFTLPKAHGKLIQGLCLSNSSKILVKNLTQISAAQVQTTLLTGTLDSGTVLFEIKNAAGVTKSSLYAQQIQTVTIGGTAMEAGDTWKINVLGADGVTTFTSDALAYNIAAADLKTAVEALLATAGWSRSNLGVTATTITASDAFANGVTITFTAGTTGTSMIPVFTASDISRAGATIVFAQTATTVAYNANAATLKAAYDALLELAGWTVSTTGAALTTTFSGALTTSARTITYAASVATKVPIPTVTCSKAATYITLQDTTLGATPVAVKVRKV